MKLTLAVTVALAGLTVATAPTASAAACPPPPPRSTALVGVGTQGVRWSVPIPTDDQLEGQSRPLVVGDATFIATQGRALLVADADGSTRWSVPLGFAPYGRVRDAGIIAVTGFTRVVGLRVADGSLAWSWTPTGRGLIGDPAVLSDHLIAVQSGDGSTTALDLRTGRPRWRHKAGGDNQVVIGSGATVVRAGLGGPLTGFDARTGRRLWRISPDVTDARWSAGRVLGFDNPGHGRPPVLTAWSGRTGKVLWRLKPSQDSMDFLVSVTPQVILDYRFHQLLAIKPSTGRVLWTVHLAKGVIADLDSQTGVHSGVVAVQQESFFTTSAGEQYVGRRLKDGKLLWRGPSIPGGQQGGTSAFSGPAVVSTFVTGTTTSHGEVQAVRTVDGAPVFDVATDLPASGPAVLTSGGAVVLTETLMTGCLL